MHSAEDLNYGTLSSLSSADPDKATWSRWHSRLIYSYLRIYLQPPEIKMTEIGPEIHVLREGKDDLLHDFQLTPSVERVRLIPHWQ